MKCCLVAITICSGERERRKAVVKWFALIFNGRVGALIRLVTRGEFSAAGRCHVKTGTCCRERRRPSGMRSSNQREEERRWRSLRLNSVLYSTSRNGHHKCLSGGDDSTATTKTSRRLLRQPPAVRPAVQRVQQLRLLSGGRQAVRAVVSSPLQCHLSGITSLRFLVNPWEGKGLQHVRGGCLTQRRVEKVGRVTARSLFRGALFTRASACRSVVYLAVRRPWACRRVFLPARLRGAEPLRGSVLSRAAALSRPRPHTARSATATSLTGAAASSRRLRRRSFALTLSPLAAVTAAPAPSPASLPSASSRLHGLAAELKCVSRLSSAGAAHSSAAKGHRVCEPAARPTALQPYFVATRGAATRRCELFERVLRGATRCAAATCAAKDSDASPPFVF